MTAEELARLESLERQVAELRDLCDKRFAWLARGLLLFHDDQKDLGRAHSALLGVLLHEGVVTEAHVDATREVIDANLAIDEALLPQYEALNQFRARLAEEIKRAEQRQ